MLYDMWGQEPHNKDYSLKNLAMHTLYCFKKGYAYVKLTVSMH